MFLNLFSKKNKMVTINKLKKDEMKITNNAQPTEKKGGLPKGLVVFGIIIIVLMVFGYAIQNFVLKKTGEKLAENLIKSKTGVDVDINTNNNSVKIDGEDGSMEVGENTKWPADLPNDVPQYNDGTIMSAFKSEDNWNIIIKDTSESYVQQYAKELEKNGWVSKEKLDFIVNLVQMEKGAYDLNLAFDTSSNGVSLTISKKQ
jgi:hypothetical protein